jgi:pimeloyl-ACP methyl ester carboxylesterase
VERVGAGLQAQDTEVRTVTSSDGTPLAVHRVTRGDHNVLMVPGGPSSGARWADVARQLDGHLSCWLMDRRGRGASGDTAPYSFEREYDDLSAAASALGGRRSTDAIAAALPRATVTVLPGQGHGALAMAPDQVAAAVLRAARQS